MIYIVYIRLNVIGQWALISDISNVEKRKLRDEEKSRRVVGNDLPTA